MEGARHEIARVIGDNQERRFEPFSLCTVTGAGSSAANRLSGSSFIGAHARGNKDDIGDARHCSWRGEHVFLIFVGQRCPASLSGKSKHWTNRVEQSASRANSSIMSRASFVGERAGGHRCRGSSRTAFLALPHVGLNISTSSRAKSQKLGRLGRLVRATPT